MSGYRTGVKHRKFRTKLYRVALSVILSPRRDRRSLLHPLSVDSNKSGGVLLDKMALHYEDKIAMYFTKET